MFKELAIAIFVSSFSISVAAYASDATGGSSASFRLGPTDSSGKQHTDGKAINVSPSELVKSESDSKRNEFDSNYDRNEIVKLWESCLQRSPDVKYIMNKLEIAAVSELTDIALVTQQFGFTDQAGQLVEQKRSITDTMLSNQIQAIADYEMGDANYHKQLCVRKDPTYAPLSEKRTNEPKVRKRIKPLNISKTEQIQLFNMLRSIADTLAGEYKSYINTRTLFETTKSEKLKREGFIDMKRARAKLVSLCGSAELVDEMDSKRNWAPLQ